MNRSRPSALLRLASWGAIAALCVVPGGLQAQATDEDFSRQTRVVRGELAASPPVVRNCDMDFTADQYNERIDCKTENANVALFDYVDTVLAFDKMRREMGREPIFTDSQMNQVMAGRERAQSAKNRARDAKTFRGVAKKQKAEDEDCYTQELIGDGKGDDIQPCESGEDCEEVLGDGIGNDDGKCRLKGNNREVCVQVCQQPLLSDSDSFDPEQAVDTEQGLEELDEALVAATSEMKRAMTRMQEAYRAQASEEGSTNECGEFQFDLTPTATALQVAQVAKNASGAAFNGCSVACNQDAFGWNCSAACLALAIIDGVLNGVNDALAIADGNNGSAQLDRVARCSDQLDTELKSVSTTVSGNASAIDSIEDKVDDLRVQVEMLTQMMLQRFDTVDGYLCVPQGQRECFPQGTVDFQIDESGFEPSQRVTQPRRN